MGDRPFVEPPPPTATWAKSVADRMHGDAYSSFMARLEARIETEAVLGQYRVRVYFDLGPYDQGRVLATLQRRGFNARTELSEGLGLDYKTYLIVSWSDE